VNILQNAEEALGDAIAVQEQALTRLTLAEKAQVEAMAEYDKACETVRRIDAAIEALTGQKAYVESDIAAVEAAKPPPPPVPKQEGPYAQLKCSGCGSTGTMLPVQMGSHVVLTCTSCKNQMIT
jgi:hypothetical protein